MSSLMDIYVGAKVTHNLIKSPNITVYSAWLFSFSLVYLSVLERPCTNTCFNKRQDASLYLLFLLYYLPEAIYHSNQAWSRSSAPDSCFGSIAFRCGSKCYTKSDMRRIWSVECVNWDVLLSISVMIYHHGILDPTLAPCITRGIRSRKFSFSFWWRIRLGRFDVCVYIFELVLSISFINISRV